MDIKALRIGIILHDSVRGEDIVLGLKHFKELDISEETFFTRYHPIKLTPHWVLDKFGFEQTYWGDNSVAGYWLNGVQELDSKMQPLRSEVYYVHELQNVMYFTKGIELTVN